MKAYMIIDCGATSCKVQILCKNGAHEVHELAGFSPIAQDISQLPIIETSHELEEIYFFGTAMEEKFWARAQKIYKTKFPHSTIYFSNDLVAAALATCGNSKGYVHIIGTGSASAFWTGSELIREKLNLGYIFEDYASGYDIAKEIIKRWNQGQLTKEEIQKLENKIELKSLISSIYQSGNIKQKLSKESYLLDLLSRESRTSILNSRLEHFFKNNIDTFTEQYTHHFVGSMAFLMKDLIAKKMQERSLSLGNIYRDTQKELIEYFKTKITN